jgi:hypothetical protein
MPNSEYRKVLLDWKSVAKHLFIYEYYVLHRVDDEKMPWPLVHAIREDIPYYHRIGAEGFYTQVGDESFQRYGMNYYVAAKLAWNSKLDVDALMEDFCQSAFGPGSTAMLAYFRRMEKALVDDNRCLSTPLKGPNYWGPRIFTDQVMRDAEECLRQASNATSNTDRKRVDFFRQGFEDFRQAISKNKQ